MGCGGSKVAPQHEIDSLPGGHALPPTAAAPKVKIAEPVRVAETDPPVPPLKPKATFVDPLGGPLGGSEPLPPIPSKKKGGRRGEMMMRANTTNFDIHANRRSESDASPRANGAADAAQTSNSPPRAHFRKRANSLVEGVERKEAAMGRSGGLGARPSVGGGGGGGGEDANGGGSQRKKRIHRSRAMSSIEGDGSAPIIRYTEYVTADDKSKTGGPSRKHARGLVASAETEVELQQRVKELQNSAAQLSSVEAELVLGVLRKHFLFSAMNPRQLMSLVTSCERMNLDPGVTVVAQGEADAEHFYIVSDGEYQVEVTKSGASEPTKVAMLSSGASFGEMALLYSTTRTATVRCAEMGVVFRLARAAYLLAVRGEAVDNSGQNSARDTSPGSGSGSFSQKQKTAAATVEDSPPWLLTMLSDRAQQKVLIKTLQEVALEPGESAFGESSPIGPVIVLVLNGNLEITGDPTKATRDDGLWRVSAVGGLASDATFKEGDIFAIGTPGDEGILAILYQHWIEREAASLVKSASERGEPADEGAIKAKLKQQRQLRLLGGSKHRCTVTALNDARCALLPCKEFLQCLPISDRMLDSREALRSMLLSTAWCAGAASKDVDAMAFAFKAALLDAGTEITTVGQEVSHLTILLSGSVRVLRAHAEQGEVLVCEGGPGDVVGEKSLAEGGPSLVTTRALEACVVLQLPREAYRSMKLGERHLSRRASEVVHRQLDEPRVAGASDAVLSDFKPVALIGAGAFASVGLVEHAGSDGVYVIKKMDRNHLVQSNMQKQIVRERVLLGFLHHPSIAKLYATFTSRDSLYMLLEPCLGGELYSYMREVNTLEEGPAAFYVACVVAALEHMHARDIMYRDLKPENIVTHANGYAKVVDFGFAKRCKARTFTLCGTPEYLAPELILMKGHGGSVDWWAVGVLLYEMLMGAAPFTWIDGEPYYNLAPTELYKNILNPRFEFYMPDNLSSDVVDLIKRLLAWQPLRRLGCLTSAALDVRSHPFFAQIDWQALYDEQIEPPRKPELASPTDTSHFDEPSEDDSFVAEPPYQPAPDAWDFNF